MGVKCSHAPSLKAQVGVHIQIVECINLNKIGHGLPPLRDAAAWDSGQEVGVERGPTVLCVGESCTDSQQQMQQRIWKGIGGSEALLCTAPRFAIEETQGAFGGQQDYLLSERVL
ncbi:uncharacterized protein [Physcomitrium patens]|uniref:uncharacterized protein n=1 Tax=Physcomitrium patens TaxID=3218 RepID=UPI003CCD3108